MVRVRTSRRLVAALALAVLPGAALQAQEPAEAPDEDAETELHRLLQRQNEVIRELILEVEDLERRLEELESAAPATRAPVEAAEPAADDVGPPRPSEQARREQERLVRSAFERTLIERGGLLLPPGSADLEPSITYTHSSSENIVIDGFTILPVLVVGDIVSETVRHEVVQAALTARVGLPWDSQLDIRVPYGYQERRSVTADDEESSDSIDGLGDISLSLSRQLTRGGPGGADLIGNLRWKTRTGEGPFDTSGDGVLATGTGYDSLGLSVTGVKVVDPVVYFGSAGYDFNLARDEDIGRFDPGDGVSVSIGMAVSLNLFSSLSFAYDHQDIQRSRLDGDTLAGSQQTIGVFSVGGSYAISNTRSLDMSMGIGVTSDAPDIQISFALPIRWRF